MDNKVCVEVARGLSLSYVKKKFPPTPVIAGVVVWRSLLALNDSQPGRLG